MSYSLRFGTRTILSIEKDEATESKKIYKQYLEDRDLNNIVYYSTPDIKKMNMDDLAYLDLDMHIWSLGDRYFKLASNYYGNPSYWWIIALVNDAPTEAHLEIGQIVHIPRNLEQVMEIL
jgi:hypothetical protein